MKKLFDKKNRLKTQLSELFNSIMTVLISLMLVALVLFIGKKVYTLFFFPAQQHFVHDIVFLLVLVKIFRLLLAYFKNHHVSIKYIVEISIIAPAIEIIFASDMHSPFILSVFLLYALANLLVYILLNDRIKVATS